MDYICHGNKYIHYPILLDYIYSLNSGGLYICENTHLVNNLDRLLKNKKVL